MVFRRSELREEAQDDVYVEAACPDLGGMQAPRGIHFLLIEQVD